MAEDGTVTALGAMSGTSLDGVDAAIVVTDGHRIEALGRTGFRPYSEDERAILGAALGKWQGPEVEAAAEVVELAHAELLSDFPEAEVVGFHGQTTAHDPSAGATCQIGSGALLAEILDRPVVWDFRSADMALGGQGAPLAPFYHFAMARHIGASGITGFLNLGGVGNLTLVDPGKDRPEAPGACLAFDTGPANARIDDLVARRTGARRDDGGGLAASGTVDADILKAMLESSWFSKMPPKSLDREAFADWSDRVAHLSLEDAAATLAAASAGAVALALDHAPKVPERILVSGGGRHNAALMEMIAGLLPCPVEKVETAGLDGDMIEAQAFAFLAVRVMRGLPTSAPGTTGVPAPVGGGEVSRPGRITGAA